MVLIGFVWFSAGFLTKSIGFSNFKNHWFERMIKKPIKFENVGLVWLV